MSELGQIRNAIVEPRIVHAILAAGRWHRWQSGENRADRAVVLPSRRVVIELSANDHPVPVQRELDLGEACGRLRGPLEIICAHPLHAHGTPNGFREDHCFVLRPSIAAVRSAVMAGARECANDHVVDRCAEHPRELSS